MRRRGPCAIIPRMKICPTFLRELLHKTYDKTMEFGRSRHAMAALVFVSFFGATWFPLPAEVIMIPMIIAAPRRAFLISTVALFASVAGGISGYFLGAFAYETIGSRLIYAMGMAEAFAEFQRLYHEWDWWLIFAGGLTPFPYKLICIASGVVRANFLIFVLASLLSRGLRYYFIAWLLAKYGERANEFIKRRLEILSIIAFVLIFAFFMLLRLI